jgi:ribosomal protein L16 Arg81 hydroxylase
MQAQANSVAVDDGWRKWIAENLLLGGDPRALHGMMVNAGVAPFEAEQELRTAIASPYLKGLDRVRARLAKRDWVLESISKVKRMHPEARTVERRHRLTRDEFLREYYSQNKAVVITGMLDDWPAMQKWSLDYFAATLGEREVEVQFGRNGDPDYEVNQPKLKRTMLFGQYVETVRHAGATNDFYMTANNSGHNKQAIKELWSDITQIPEYLDGSDPMDGFFWLGPAGTITPFHHDLTNNFMAQVIGRKRVLMIPASELPRTYNHLHCYTTIDGRNIDYDRFPSLREATMQEVVLVPGEILFLPIGHWHFVEGLDISCTMSFTNFVFDNDFSSFYHTYNGV